jgi:23S rRNA (guanosine2251-2'-O)-methyltransferase
MSPRDQGRGGKGQPKGGRGAAAGGRGGQAGRGGTAASGRGRGAAPTGGRGGSRAGGGGGGRQGSSGAPARSGQDDVRPIDDGGGDAERRRPTGRRNFAGDQIEGRQAVRELLLAGRRRTVEVYVATGEDGRLDGPLQELVELADDLRVTVKRVSRAKVDSLARTEAPQGVVAHAEELPEADLDDLITTRTRAGGPPFLVAVDGVTDPGNLGAVLRSAECAGASGIVLPRHRAVHITPTVAKAAAGAVEHLPIAVVSGLPSAIERVKRAGVWVVGLDAGGSTPLGRLPFAVDPVLLVLGAEGAGLTRLVRERCDAIASIPLYGVTESLNVAAAAAIATYEIARARAAAIA